MTATSTPPTAPTANGLVWHVMPVPDVFAAQHVDEVRGLSSEDVEQRRQEVGPNQLTTAETEPQWHALLRQYQDPMQIVLVVAGVGSIYPLEQYGTALVLFFLTVVNAVIGFRQEGKAAAAVAALQKMMIVTCKVRRDGELREVPAHELVPGDVVLLEAGDLVPADGRIVKAATFEVAESALTGESLPVSKSVTPVSAEDTPLGDRTDMAYMNTSVTRGSGEIVVTGTGMSTEVGHISHMLEEQDDSKTPLTKQLDTLTNQILFISGFALIASMLMNLARGYEFNEVFNAAIAFAVSAIPTGLPAVVTTILSMGTQTLAKAGAIMKRLRSTETLGSTSAINSDKTGTLTLNQMTAVEMTLPGRRYTISGEGYSTEGRINRVGGEPDVPLDQFLLPMALASDAVVRDGELVGDPTEGAMIVLAAKGGVDPVTTRERYPRLATLPFDADYKLMATFHTMADASGREVVRCFVKGAPDQLLARATTVLDAKFEPEPVNEDFSSRYMEENERLASQGLRVLATARRDFDPATFDADGDLLLLMQELTLLTLVGIVDPPRAQARDAIAAAHDAGIQVRMITGDHAVTAQAIATQLGIKGRAITGAEWAAMSDEEAHEQIADIGVIARVAPSDKVRLVDVLKGRGEIVAMTGDGVNDAPALKKADIGIAMGITGTEVSKEAAVMILTDDNFATIVKAVELGRGLYDNLKKYIRFQIAVLIGFIVSFLGASLLNIVSGVPFLPLQTLWINFTVDLFLAIGLGYGKPAEGLMKRKPRASDEEVLPRPLLMWLASVGLLMGVATLAVIALGARNYDDAMGRTMGLVVFSLMHIVFATATKDEDRSMLSLDFLTDRPFLICAGLSMLAVILQTSMDVLQRILSTGNLELQQWLACLGITIVFAAFCEIGGLIRRRRADA